jgi:O-antigen ligase
VWELFQGELDWFSRMGIIPALAEVDVVRDAEPWIGNADLSKWYKAGGNDGKALNASVTRRDLWTAAGRMFLERPLLGVGPDNYRLRYGSYLDHTKWDRNIRANNLYLEVLTGSGIAGLVFFLVMMARRDWRLTPVSLALAAFMVHGLVDVFLMTTPIYFGFWVLMGLGAEGGRA